MVKYDVFVAYLVLCVKGWETGLLSLAKAKNRHQRWHHSIDRIPFNQHIFSSYITSIILKYVDRCTVNILWGDAVCTPFFQRTTFAFCTPFFLRTTFAFCTPFFLRTTFAFTQVSFTVTPPHPSPLPRKTKFGRRLDFVWTLFCISFCSY